jgi:hypothetical protein
MSSNILLHNATCACEQGSPQRRYTRGALTGSFFRIHRRRIFRDRRSIFPVRRSASLRSASNVSAPAVTAAASSESTVRIMRSAVSVSTSSAYVSRARLLSQLSSGPSTPRSTCVSASVLYLCTYRVRSQRTQSLP